METPGQWLSPGLLGRLTTTYFEILERKNLNKPKEKIFKVHNNYFYVNKKCINSNKKINWG